MKVYSMVLYTNSDAMARREGTLELLAGSKEAAEYYLATYCTALAKTYGLYGICGDGFKYIYKHQIRTEDVDISLCGAIFDNGRIVMLYEHEVRNEIPGR